MSFDYNICVTVVDCEGEPIVGAHVTAFDQDPEQVDQLEDGTTNGEGVWCTSLSPSKFKPTTTGIMWEGGPGPNLFFHVDAGIKGTLVEHRSTGWGVDRQAKSGEVLEVTLTVCGVTPRFTHIGDFEVGQHFDSNGRTTQAVNGHGGPDYGFHKTLALRGQVPSSSAGEQVRYRFLWQAPNQAQVPINGAMIEESDLGTRQIQWENTVTGDGGAAWQLVKVGPSASDPGLSGPYSLPPPLVIEPDPSSGWIEVPPDIMLSGSGVLLNFDSTAAHPGGPNPSLGDEGTPIKIRFEAETVSQTPIGAPEVEKIYVNNWDPSYKLSINPAPCTPVIDKAAVAYLLDHELVQQWALVVASQSSTDGHDAGQEIAANFGARGGSGIHKVEDHPNLSIGNKPLAAWQPCPYEVTFQVQLRLTNGFDDDPPRSRTIDFCKCE